MSEKYFIWDEVSEGLILLGAAKAEDEQIKGRKKQTIATQMSEIYCPHAYLILNYQETLNDSEKIKFRKHYLRKVTPSESNIIILQDIKDLVLFLLITPVSPQFINFFHLPIVDRFLRALIIYFQCYIEIWEDLMQEQAATMKKAPNPLARGYRSRYAEEMRTLRCVLGREYIDLIAGCQSGSQYHHMMTKKKQLAAIMQSQGEKDLRIFEALISVAHRVVWIALQRKHYNLIEMELHRLFRTEAYNTAQRQSGSQVIQDMLEDDICVLHGPKIALKRKLLRNTPLLYELIYSYCDYRLLSLEIDVDVDDPKIVYLKGALFIEEEMLPQLGIKVGILGQNRSDYDIMLIPNEPERAAESIEANLDKEMAEKRKTIPIDKISVQIQEITRRSSQKFEYGLVKEFTMKNIETSTERYEKIRKDANRKWIFREIKRRNHKLLDSYSVTTTIE